VVFSLLDYITIRPFSIHFNHPNDGLLVIYYLGTVRSPREEIMNFWTALKEGRKESSIEWMIYSNIAVTTLWSQYFYSEGYNPVQIGLLMAMIPLMSFVSNPFFFRLASSVSEQKIIRLVAFIPAILVWGVFLFSGFWFKLWIILPVALTMSAVIPLAEGMVIQSLKKKGLRFDHIRLWGTIGYSCTILISGLLVQVSYAWVFAFSTMSLLVVGAIGPLLAQTPVAVSVKQQPTVPLGQMKTFLIMLGFSAVATSVGSMSSVFLPMLTDGYGFPEWAPGVSFSIMAISEVPFLLLGERILKRLGNIRLLAIGISAIAFRVLLMSWIAHPLGFFFTLPIHGLGYITVYYALFQFIHYHLSPHQVRNAQVLLWITLQGINFTVGSLGGGWLVEQTGVLTGYRFAGWLGLAIAAGAWVYSLQAKRAAHTKERE